MKNVKYAINKYYTLEEINVAVGEPIVQALMEKFMVVHIYEDIDSDTLIQEVWGDNFNTYKDAFSYIEGLLELSLGGQGYEKT